ncbi:indolepyruvate ferredoxin oxidoreductase family protein [Sphaerotilus uruguayifluvii]|uniref:Indolepyruvate ferredoxin oxidoreductase n=1 Tax=Sphaerotilus uruguayifluvii TaxID=2735897 RepID=A0ABX2FYW4_9BURK|nr:indolepyruvate ferredoxin oxidoreductase family protein [Leptothrix sp. C29]NRT54383.1 indolepyruvate ferredoxin oxidoreductase [Leptothrix sp. C29]
MNAPLPAHALLRPEVRLEDALLARGGTVLLSGTQALVRLPLMQRALDAAAGLGTGGFVSGYRGSPLGQVDQQVWKAKAAYDAAGVRFLPAINEELAATAVLGTQRVEADQQREVDGVFALWYGKGPGVDRAGDALHHGNAYGASPHGGVLVVAGDDHGCVSSSMPHQSDRVFQAWRMPVLSPANLAELIEFGLHGWALSRFSGAWVGMTALSEVVESSATVDLDAIARAAARWQAAEAVRAQTGFVPPADGLHYRWPDLPSLAIEQRLHAKLDAVRAFARVNPVDRMVIESAQATVGIVTVGKAHADLMEVLRRLELSPAQLAAAGVRLYKVGLSWPVEPTRLRAFAQGLREILVVEEKAPIVEEQLRELLYAAPADARPALIGKRDRSGAPLLSELGELRPSRLIEPVAAWLAAHDARLDRRALVVDFTVPRLPAGAPEAPRRAPWFCAGCPHNLSTKVPEGSRAQAGIGCHFMASWMDRDTEGLIQMGGEGVDWVSHAMFTREPHVFQNLGDGTYYHSGYLAIRQAVAAKATLTYKILFNDAVAMTGGQPVDGVTSPDRIARQVEAEGVVRIALLSDDIGRYDGQRERFPAGTTFHDRDALDAVQRELRATKGVTVLIYEQTCAAEKRRRRRKGAMDTPARRLHIHPGVCEGCGDCSAQSNCVAVQPIDTPMGRKRRIDASACNLDESCAKGFCPSFVGLVGATPRRRSGALTGATGAGSDFRRRVEALPAPARPDTLDEAPWDLLVTGVGGTGVITVGMLIAMAAHLEGRAASVLDFMGFAQKGGAVLSFVRLADRPELLHPVRIDAQQADALLACDLVVGASPEALQTLRHGRTRVVANRHETPVAASMHQPDAQVPVADLCLRLERAAGADRLDTLDAQQLAEAFLGDTIVSNIVALGFAWQRGLVPVGLAALERAIELNGVAVEANRAAFALGRLAAGDAEGCRALLDTATAALASAGAAAETLDALLARGTAHLSAYQDAAWAARWRERVEQVRAFEAALPSPGSDAPADLALTRTVATQLLRLMSVKDEYEVARLLSDPAFLDSLKAQYEGDWRLEFHLAPPWLGTKKRRFDARWMQPLLRLLAHGRAWRGRWFDPFGHSAERRGERVLLAAYEARVDELIEALRQDAAPARRRLAQQIAAVPATIRGYGHVRQRHQETALAQEAELLHRLDPARHPRPAGGAQAGQFRGIAISATR